MILFFVLKAVDIFWGLKNSLNLNTEKEDILKNFYNELKKCQDYSIGLNFLAIIGDDIGYKLLPRSVERIHFETVIKCLQVKGINVSNLEKFYKLNINHLSNIYELEGSLRNIA